MDFVGDRVALADLYKRWEHDFWSSADIDLSRDRLDWVKLSDRERRQWYWIAGFSHFQETEPGAIPALAMLLSLLPLQEQQGVLALQVADESRHARFFERFHEEVLATALPEVDQNRRGMSEAYQRLAIDGVTTSARVAVEEPNCGNLAAAVFHIFIVMEGSFALASFSMIRILLSRLSIFPGLNVALTKIHQDEIRHAQLGIAILQDLLPRDASVREAVIAKHHELIPLFSEVLRPQSEREALLLSLGFKPSERRQRAFAHLKRHYGVLGLDPGLLETWETLDAGSSGCAHGTVEQRAQA